MIRSMMLCGVLTLFCQWPQEVDTTTSERAAIVKVIEDAYIRGMYFDRDQDAIEKGFHQAFTMFVNVDGKVQTRSRQEWIRRVTRHPPLTKEQRKQVRWEFASVDISGGAAVARLEVHKAGRHEYTDFLSLYRFEDGWRVVAKTFHRHR